MLKDSNQMFGLKTWLNVHFRIYLKAEKESWIKGKSMGSEAGLDIWMHSMVKNGLR